MIHPRSDGMALEVEAFAGGILRLRAGAIDGFADGLLNRYGFITHPAPCPGAVWEGRHLGLPGGWSLDLDEDLGFTLARDGKAVLRTIDGHRPGTGATIHQNQGYQLATAMQPAERLVGFGDQNRQTLLLNGQRGSLWIRNQCSYIPVPFLMSSAGWGILFNTTRRLFYDIAASDPGRCEFRVAKDYLDVYLFTGDGFRQLLTGYLTLTGFPQLPPAATMGLWLIAQESIRAHELLQLAHHMREAAIPCDILALEPGWMEKTYDETVDKAWNRERFPHFPWADKRPSTFIGDLKLMGYHFGLWMCSNYDHTWEEERRIAGRTIEVRNLDEPVINRADLELAEKDQHFGHQPMLMDRVTRPDQPFFAHLRPFVDQGVDFFKQDGYAQINLHPDRLYGNGLHDDEMHNLNPLIYTRQMIEGFESHAGRRAFTLTVSGWTGYQRFPGVWTGDTGGGAQPLCGILQNAIVGQPFATCDMDVDCLQGIHMGFLLPWAQINSWDYYRYPVYKGAQLRRIITDYANLRMRLLPYLYALARAATVDGWPIARPMPFVHPDRDLAYGLTRQFMLGDALLVGVYSPSIVLPTGRWYDLWSGRLAEGAWEPVAWEVPADRGGHLFLREGSLLPLGPVQQHVGEKPLTDLTWLVFPGAEACAFELYADDGASFAHRDGGFALTGLRCTRTEDGVAFAWEPITGRLPGLLADITHRLEVVLDRPGCVRQVLVDGQDAGFTEDPARGILIVEGIRHGQDVRVLC